MLKKYPSPKKRFNIPNLHVYHPVYLFPLRLQKIAIIEKINKLASTLSTISFINKVNPDFLWTFDPKDSILADKLKSKVKIIYDCVDYFTSLNRQVAKNISQKEKELIKKADYFFVNSEVLNKKKAATKNPTTVVAQGFDIDSYSENTPLSKSDIREIDRIKDVFHKIPKPIVGFVGNLSYRINFKLLAQLIAKMPDVSFVITDAFLPFPEDDKFADTQKQIKKLKNLTNLWFIPKTFKKRVVKKIISYFDIGIIPYNTSFDFNRYCYPMKLFEYFYMGKPVVSTPIEELKKFPSHVKIGGSVSMWEKHIKKLLENPWPRKYKIEQRKLAVENSWKAKVEKILENIG